MTSTRKNIRERAATGGKTMGDKRLKTIQKKKPPSRVNRRPDVPPEVQSIQETISSEIRANIRSIIEAEEGLDDPITLNQLGSLMGFSSANIYGIMNNRNEIGVVTVSRFSFALGCDPWLLLMPNDEFRRSVIPNYIRYRKGLSDGSDIKPKRSSKKVR